MPEPTPRYRAVLSMTVTKPDGSTAAVFTNDYQGMEYADLLGLQEAVSNALLGLGKAALAAKAGKSDCGLAYQTF